MNARQTFVAALACIVFGACGPRQAAESLPPPVPLSLALPCDLVPAAGVDWLIEARPREVAEIADLIPAIGLVVSEARFNAFAKAHGGVDVRSIERACVSRHGTTLLAIARTPLDPARVQAAFTERSTRLPVRFIDVQNPPVVRLSGEVAGERQEMVTFDRELVAVEYGPQGPLRASEAFAQGKLRRASPALRSHVFAPASTILGDAPVRAFIAGPFEGDTAKGLGGLLRATTSVGVSATSAGPGARIAVRLVLTGAWGKDGPAAAERFGAAVNVISESSLGRLFGLQHPVEGPRVHATDDALILDATLDANALARGIHAALDADVTDMMSK